MTERQLVEDTGNEAETTAKMVRNFLTIFKWQEAKTTHFRHPQAPTFAVEVGYVYGECTVRFNTLNGQVDTGTFEVMRGLGEPFLRRVAARIKELGGPA